MRAFLLHITLYGLAIAVALFGVILLADGTTDPYYLRTTTPRQAGLIVGTSRAAQGLIPSLMTEGWSPIYNFSFTALHSPYGPAYLQAIQRKMDHRAKNAHHIVTVEPWGLCSDRIAPNDPTRFEENALFPGTVPRMDANPNLGYFLHGGVDRLWNVLANRVVPDRMVVREDGWLQVDIERTPEEVEKRIEEVLTEGRARAPKVAFSSLREEYLRRTVRLLCTTGTVHLVRMPVSAPLRAQEDSLFPDFTEKMERLGRASRVGYVDLSAVEGYSFTDGSHLDQGSARRLSVALPELCANKPVIDP